MNLAWINLSSRRSTLPGYSFLGTAGACIHSNKFSRTSAGTPVCRRIGIGQLVASLGLPERSRTHDSQMLLTFSNRRSGRTRILKVDWVVGEIRRPTTACLMEASGIFTSHILRLTRCAGISHSNPSISRGRCSLSIP